MKKIKITKAERMIVDMFALDLLIDFIPQKNDSEFVRIAKLWAGDVVKKNIDKLERKFLTK